jgi:glutathione S-transferase
MEREQAAALLDQGSGSTASRYAAVLDQHLEGRDYAACGRLTIADFQLASMASYWKTSAMPFAEYADLTAWIDRMMRIPAWADLWP